MAVHRPHPSPDDLPVPLSAADRAACLALDQRALGGFWSDAQWQAELGQPGRPALGFWGEGQLRAMACGWLVVDELHIVLVATDPTWRRQGLARRLLAALMARAAAAGARHATLEVAAGNGAARALYGQLGFREAGRRRGYYRNGDDALIQWCRLVAEGVRETPI
ncbi:MAG: GNAT family N-acetyltransferase [Cyanobacteriota bacterium]|nr:GNAT family N-acetyltransferase [Cyanobacteriota bacterium]